MKIKDIILGSTGYIFLYKKPLSKALLAPFLIYLLSDLITADGTQGVDASILFFVFGALGLALQTIIAVTTHRIILLGPDAVPEWGIYKWTWRETFFALYIIGIALLSLPFYLFAFIPILGWIFMIAGIGWLAGRLSLVFPSIAVNQALTFGTSWNLTKNYQLTMMFVVMIFPILLMLPIYAVSFLPYGEVLGSVISTIMTVFIVSSLSVAYKGILDNALQSGLLQEDKS